MEVVSAGDEAGGGAPLDCNLGRDECGREAGSHTGHICGILNSLTTTDYL